MSDQEEVHQNYPPDLDEYYRDRDEDYQNYPPDLLECDLCNNYDYRTGKVSLHGSWNCHRYNTPQKARQRCIFKNLCIACMVPLSDHKEKCDESNISFYNGDPCCQHQFYRCWGTSHVF